MSVAVVLQTKPAWVTFEWTVLRILFIYSLSLATAILLLSITACSTRKVVTRVRRLQAVMRSLLGVSLAGVFAHGIAAYVRSEPLTFPQYGTLRPLASGVVFLLAFFVTMHHGVRLLVLPCLAGIIALDSCSSEIYAMEENCMQAGTCVGRGTPVWVASALWYRDVAGIALCTTFLLFTAYFMLVIGACTQRFNARQFSTAQPPSRVPASIKRSESAEHLVPAAQGMGTPHPRPVVSGR